MKHKLNFDKNGFLIPHEKIESNIEIMKEYFVDAFPKSQTRKTLFQNYEKYIADFRFEIFPHFEQWIGGSFISKKEKPNDIDFVTFLDYKIVELRGKTIDKFWNFSLESKHIDSYIVEEYPNDHEKFDKYRKSQELKHKLYSTTREGIPKGYLKFIFTK